jgi:transcriptional regulator with XRE-family HTH domain
MAKKKPPPKRSKSAMDRVREAFDASDLSMQELGEKMGYADTTARQAVSQFLKSDDPRVSMVQKFAKAVGKKASDFID